MLSHLMLSANVQCVLIDTLSMIAYGADLLGFGHSVIFVFVVLLRRMRDAAVILNSIILIFSVAGRL